jgi:hypothetical protein
MKNLKIIIVIVVVVILVAIAVRVFGQGSGDVASVKGCYVANLVQDVYTLNIKSQSGNKVSGSLEFKNFEKDSSHGDFKGTFENGVLLADYKFTSEGTDSVMQVIFKKTTDGFVRGFGTMHSEDDGRLAFITLDDVAYQPPLFEKEDCK